MIYFCCDALRRTQLFGSALNGIDYLEVLDRDAPIFSIGDFIALSSLVGKLGIHSDPLSQFLWNQFSAQTQQVLTDPNATAQEQASALVAELNTVIQGGDSIYAPPRFAGVPLSPETLQLLAQNPQGDDLVRLNRLLLEDGYPLEIAKSPDRQCKLFVHFINNLGGAPLSKSNIRIEGGERIRDIMVTDAQVNATDATVLDVSVDQPGDFSIYTLRLVQDAGHPQPPDGIDPMFAAVDFSFKVECPTVFDCRPQCVCPPAPRPEPEIDYLAKDYESFRRLMLDRMSALMPQWQERNPSDLGVALVEMLAYVGDSLSYRQDAVATEAYLATARRRISVRRHARLLDYVMHDGCNARAWVQVQVSADVPLMAAGTQLFTRIPGQPAVLPDDPLLLARAQEAFETMEAVALFADHNEINFYTWSDQRCCLPEGATNATLEGPHPNLKPGNVLIFEETLGPNTGQPEDANPLHRHAARLTDVQAQDAHGNPLTDLLTGQAITEIAWADADALPFPLCISAQTDAEHGARYLKYVSVARGNIVLADHGRTVSGEPLGSVPTPTVFKTPPSTCDRCEPQDPVPVPPRFRPALEQRPLTQAAPYDSNLSARAAMVWDIRDAMAAIALDSVLKADKIHWTPKRDLLESGPTDPDFVVETEADDRAWLRFGDDLLGLRPEPRTSFSATYRVGNGAAGNVGAEAIAHLVTADPALAKAASQVRNPLAAQGGIEPESVENVREYAPAAFRTQERAVTETDYGAVTERHPEVQRAVATFRWTGSWHTVFITVDRLGGLAVDDAFKAEIRQFVERFRMAGYDLEVDGPRFVSLEIDMQVCVQPDYFREDVKAVLLELFSNRILPDGRRGLFHPDNFTFGQTVYLSPLIAAAQAVAGVASVQVMTFQRQGTPDPKPLEAGKLELARLEIARCDNDPNFAERGVFQLSMGGGK